MTQGPHRRILRKFAPGCRPASSDDEDRRMQNAPQDLDSIARRGSPLRRMAARIPTYLADVKESPTWLPMFLLARTMPARKAHWRTAAKVVAEPAKPSMFAGVDREQVAAGLKADGIFPGLVLPKP